ncbi:hypothetical protein CBS9595_002645 [Malassezia furfur]|nr:hypothetical protein CBS9595_002645 [Malassezia furfur]
MSARKTGAKQPEVIQQWADMDSEGATFERHRMDAQVQSICITDQAGVPEALKDASKGIKVKASDVNYLTQQFLIPTHMAETALVQGGGDVNSAVSILLTKSLA